MKDRIKEIRKSKKLTQQQFGDMLNVSKSTIESIEYGHRNITDRTLLDICRVFSVNEVWLRTGDGNMYQDKSREEEIAELVISLARSEDDAFTLKLAEILPKLNDRQLESLYNIAIDLADLNENKKSKNEKDHQ